MNETKTHHLKIPFTLFQTFFNGPCSFFGDGDGRGLAVGVGDGVAVGEGLGVGLGVSATFELAGTFELLRPFPRHQRATSKPDPVITISKKIASTSN